MPSFTALSPYALLDVTASPATDVMPHELTSARRQVDLYENGTIAIVEAVSPELGNRVQRVRVQLPGTSQELLQRFRDKSVDFAAHSNTEDGGAVFLNLLGARMLGYFVRGYALREAEGYGAAVRWLQPLS